MALQGNKIVVVGFSGDHDGIGGFALARYNPDGSLDTNFSGDGKQTTALRVVGDGGERGGAPGDGKIVAVGTTDHGSHTRSFALARYNLNGSLDTSFSGDGKQTTDRFGDRRANGVAIQADGKIVAVGEASDGGDFALARFNPNGSLDTSFSGDGMQATDFGVGDRGEAGWRSRRRQDRRGRRRRGPRLRACPLQPERVARPSFSGDGKQTTDFLFGGGDSASDVAIQANGRIVAVGVASGGATGQDFALARYNPNGSLDASFSGDGRKRTSFGAFDIANGVALQGDGRIVAVGDGNGEFALARYLGG